MSSPTIRWRDSSTTMPFPDALASKVKAAFEPVFIEVEFLDSVLLADAFQGVEEDGKFDIVQLSSQHAQSIDLDSGTRAGDAALVYFKLASSAAPTPAHWLKRLNAKGWASATRASIARIRRPRCTSPSPTATMTRAKSRVSLTLNADRQDASAPQTTTTVLKPHNIDATRTARAT